MMSKIVIIPVHNQLDYLIKCIESLLKKTYDFELIIVNDGSTDEDIIKWFNNCELNCTIIHHKEALGFSRACNSGIDFAIENFDFECLCLLNSDTEIITNNWFDKVEIYFKENDNIGVASVVSNNAGIQTVDDKYLINIDEKRTVITYLPHGFCYFISKKLINTIGRFDDDLFPHYGSEDDYSLKSIQYGFVNILVGSVYIKHKGSTTYSTEKRKTIIKSSLPNLINRWGDDKVQKLIKQSVNQIKIMKEYNEK
jgi:GT2 family glycosyltransferase